MGRNVVEGDTVDRWAASPQDGHGVSWCGPEIWPQRDTVPWAHYSSPFTLVSAPAPLRLIPFLHISASRRLLIFLFPLFFLHSGAPAKGAWEGELARGRGR